MTQLQLEQDLIRWFIQGAFIAALVFGAVYVPFFEWHDTVTGRAIVTLVLSLAGALFHSVLIIWGVPSFQFKDGEVSLGPWWANALNWLSIISLGAIVIAIAMLAWQTLRYLNMHSVNKWACRLLWLGRPEDREILLPWEEGLRPNDRLPWLRRAIEKRKAPR